MRSRPAHLLFAVIVLSTQLLEAQGVDPSAAMRWRQIGPGRAGRARALAGVPSQPNVFYIGFDNGGVWRSTDYGSTWLPLFDSQPTGSIGALAKLFNADHTASFTAGLTTTPSCTNSPSTHSAAQAR